MTDYSEGYSDGVAHGRRWLMEVLAEIRDLTGHEGIEAEDVIDRIVAVLDREGA